MNGGAQGNCCVARRVMIRGLAIAFVVTFVGAHVSDQYGDALSRPLSCFRDVEPSWVGYTMFALLIAIATEMVRTAKRRGDRRQVLVYAVVVASLTIVALTPSNSALHSLAVFLTLVTLFGNYAWLLDQRDMPYCLTAHLSIPLALVAINFLVPSGGWEKALDLYFMAAVLIHHHAMTYERAMANPLSETVDIAHPAESQPVG